MLAPNGYSIPLRTGEPSDLGLSLVVDHYRRLFQVPPLLEALRNLDLIGLILFAPGLLLVTGGWKIKADAFDVLAKVAAHPSETVRETEPLGPPADQENGARPTVGEEPPVTSEDKKETYAAEKKKAEALGLMELGRRFVQWGYLWLFGVSLFFLFRMLIDSAMVRRPLLEPNLTASGLTFACVAMLVFLMSNVITHGPTLYESPVAAASAEKQPAQETSADILKQRGPGYPWFHVFSRKSDSPVKPITAIVAYLAIVVGMVLIGYRHFDNTHTGIAAATLYSAAAVSRPLHATDRSRRAGCIRPGPGHPIVSTAGGGRDPSRTDGRPDMVSIVLLPLWCSFYWRRGLLRFSVAVLVVLGLVAASLAFMPASLGSFTEQLRQTFGIGYVARPYIHGFWEGSLAPCAIRPPQFLLPYA